MKTSTSFRDEEELLAACALSAAREMTLRDRIRLLAESSCLRDALATLPGSGAELIEHARRTLDAVRSAGYTALCLTDPRYPHLLRLIPDPPLVLTVWGRLERADNLAIAIVGSRRASRYGLEMGRQLSAELSESGLTIVSGLARGIDAAAHRGALEASGRTIAVLGSGLRSIYPREHRKLAAHIAEQGAVLSELGLDAPPLGGHFPRRNRIITGLSLGTLVVEAATKSGSLVSARLALEQDREVFAVPGPARSKASAGTHALLRDGAVLVTEVDHVLCELLPDVRAALSKRQSASRAAADNVLENPIERSLLEALSSAGEAVDLDTLVSTTDVPVHRALAALSSLELQERIWSLPGGLYQVRL